jgi:hypothetical protein
MTTLRKSFTITALALLVALGVFGATVPKIAHAANTCSTSSPTLGRTDTYFTFDGVAKSALLSIAEFGTLSKSNPNSDCVFMQTEVQTFDGELMYPPDEFYLNAWFQIGGVWTPEVYHPGVFNCPFNGCRVEVVGALLINGNPGSSVTGVLNADGPALYNGTYYGSATYVWSYATEYVANPGSNLPDTNASALVH